MTDFAIPSDDLIIRLYSFTDLINGNIALDMLTRSVRQIN